MGGERHRHEHDNVEPQRLGGEVRVIAFDHAGLLEPRASPRALRGGQPHAQRQVLIGQPTVALQRRQQLAIEFVHAQSPRSRAFRCTICAIYGRIARLSQALCGDLPVNCAQISAMRQTAMGPFPHDAPPASISAANPAGTDGFEFVEFAHPRPLELERLFQQMGYVEVARHKHKNISLYRQGRINYLINREPHSHAARFVEEHGPSAPAMGWRVVNAKHALERVLACGGTRYEGSDTSLGAPAVIGIGGSLLYLIEAPAQGGSPYDREFHWLGARDPRPAGVGFHYIDHLTHNVRRGNMETWYRFYAETFKFRE